MKIPDNISSQHQILPITFKPDIIKQKREFVYMFKKIFNGFKYFLIGLVCLLITIFLFLLLTDSSIAPIKNISTTPPNYNYIPDIKKLKEEGKLQEALELARFVLKHSDMPGQEEAKELEKELEYEINSHWGMAKRFMKGFIFGSGSSIEEIGGGITSDLIVWGDFRDLIKQGYYKITEQETDPFIIALAGIGLLTEFVDIADWAPAVLKAFRKVGALSKKFADFVITAAKNSGKTGKLDTALKVVFKNINTLVDKMGLARTATIMKHVDEPADLLSVTTVAEKNADVAYLLVKNGGPDGIGIMKQMGNTDDAIRTMEVAAKKGPAGIQWLRIQWLKNKYVIGTRVAARIIKNLRLERPQQIVKQLITMYPKVNIVLWATAIVALILSLLSFYKSFNNFFALLRNNKEKILGKGPV